MERPSKCSRPDLQAALTASDEAAALHSVGDASSPDRSDELQRHVLECTVCGPLDQVFQKAESFLGRMHARNADEFVCPPAEQLFDYAAGVAGTENALTQAEQTALEDHIAVCGDCQKLVATLAMRPPVPLIDDSVELLPFGVTPAEPAETAERSLEILGATDQVPAPTRSGWLSLLKKGAAAAAVLAIGIWAYQSSDALRAGANGSGTPSGFPELELMRGAQGDGAWFPRGLVLANEQGQPHNGLHFEMRDAEGAQSYSFKLSHIGEGAFDGGELVLNLESPTADLQLSATELSRLQPGRYSWQGWANIRGITSLVGSQEFELVSNPPLLERCRAERGSSLEVLHQLHEAGFSTDARSFARREPISAEQKRFLASQIQR